MVSCSGVDNALVTHPALSAVALVQRFLFCAGTAFIACFDDIETVETSKI